jgi:hypothetical protein
LNLNAIHITIKHNVIGLNKLDSIGISKIVQIVNTIIDGITRIFNFLKTCSQFKTINIPLTKYEIYAGS